MKTILCICIFLLSYGVLAQDIPSVESLGIDQVIAESRNTLNTLPDQLDDDMMPAETATQLFAWLRWIFSDTGARELFGSTLAPIAINLYVMLGIVVSFTVLWLTIRALVLAWRFIMWVADWIIKLFELIPFVE